MTIDKDASVRMVMEAITELVQEWLCESEDRVVMLAFGDKAAQADGTDGLGLYFGGPHEMMGVTTAAISMNIPPLAKFAMAMALQDKDKAEVLKPRITKQRTREEILDQLKNAVGDFDGMDEVEFGTND